MNFLVQKLETPPQDNLPVEIVERKGRGHPDTICDSVAEEFSRGLSRFYLEHFGQILHHNVDKCDLIGGTSEPRFGGGEVTRPIEIILVGRAATEAQGTTVPIHAIAAKGTASWVKRNFRFLDPEKHIRIKTAVRRGSADLASLFGTEVPIANDTSIGLGFAPLSELERLVLSTEELLNSPATKERFPALGEDIKVMGVRTKSTILITVACAFVSRFTATLEEYLATKVKALGLLQENAQKFTRRRTTFVLNAADNPEEKRAYLTVTGTSAECGDDGQVGRGNRQNGLITPCRPMTMEASCGKNPLTHTGKLYSVVAGRIAEELVRDHGIEEAQVYLVSRIGSPLTEPQVLHVRSRARVTLQALRSLARKVARKHLSEITELWRDFLAEEVRLV